MSAYYVKLLVYQSFPNLYYVLAKKYGKNFRRCFRLEDEKLYGIIVSEIFLFGVEDKVSIFITLEEKENSKVAVEVIPHAGGSRTVFFDSYKRWIQKIL